MDVSAFQADDGDLTWEDLIPDGIREPVSRLDLPANPFLTHFSMAGQAWSMDLRSDWQSGDPHHSGRRLHDRLRCHAGLDRAILDADETVVCNRQHT